MPVAHTQIIRQVKQNDPARDFCVNNVYHEIGSVVPGDVDWDNHANEIKDLFGGNAQGSGSSFQLYSQSALTVKVYDHDDPKPRLPKAIAHYAPANWATYAMGPRDVQCCLSFYATNPSIKRERGRIYIGPWPNLRMGEFVADGDLDMLLDLGHGLFDIGGENVSHVVYSPTSNAIHTIQHYWCNNQWDTVRSRDVKETNRKFLSP